MTEVTTKVHLIKFIPKEELLAQKEEKVAKEREKAAAKEAQRLAREKEELAKAEKAKVSPVDMFRDDESSVLGMKRACRLRRRRERMCRRVR
jgi:hypothetical protein